jgi:hypothetical protein
MILALLIAGVLSAFYFLAHGQVLRAVGSYLLTGIVWVVYDLSRQDRPTARPTYGRSVFSIAVVSLCWPIRYFIWRSEMRRRHADSQRFVVAVPTRSEPNGYSTPHLTQKVYFADENQALDFARQKASEMVETIDVFDFATNRLRIIDPDGTVRESGWPPRFSR